MIRGRHSFVITGGGGEMLLLKLDKVLKVLNISNDVKSSPDIIFVYTEMHCSIDHSKTEIQH